MKRYNYYELIKEVENIVSQHPFVTAVYLDRDILDHDNTCYPAVAVTTDNINVGESETTVSLNMLYVERLTSTESNALASQSKAIDVLTEIINVLRECLDMNTSDDLSIIPLKNQYADNLAGAYVNGLSISIQSNTSRCSWYEPKPRC